MKILIISFEDNRWGAIRLIKALHDGGAAVAALCPPDHAMTQTKFLSGRYALEQVRSRCKMESALSRAMREWRPSLVIPGDERAIAFLHALMRRVDTGVSTKLDAASLVVLARSLGESRHYDTLLMKNETLSLARRLSLRTPEGGSVSSAEEAMALAKRIGFPVYLKKAFSWAGQGVVRCQGPEDIVTAFASMQSSPRDPLTAALRAWMGRDWYPTSSVVDVQAAIDGTPALYCLSAWKGVTLAGFAGRKLRTTHENGPSSVIRLGAHEEMARISGEMIAATGATGFMAFDFMVERNTEKAYLIECNPRPVPCCHLGPRIGVDLSQALIDALNGEVKPVPPARHAETVALFPQEWQRSPAALADFRGFVDAPDDDEALLARMMQGAEAARSRSKLRSRMSVRPPAFLPACASVWTRRAPFHSLPKQVWKNAFVPHGKAARAFRL